MEFYIDGDSWRSKYIGVYPAGRRAFSVIISQQPAPDAEPRVIMCEVGAEEELLRLLIAEGVAEEEARESLQAQPRRTRMILAAVGISSALSALIGFVLLLAAKFL